jgi:hypothetical protein
MGLVVDGMNCLLCDRPLRDGEPLFGTHGVWLPTSDRLHRYCDAVLHWECYADWKYRLRFARSLFDRQIQRESFDPYWWQVYRDEVVFVEASPSPSKPSVGVHVAGTGSSYVIPVGEWEAWLVADSDSTMHPLEWNTLAYVKRVLRRALPKAEAVLAAIETTPRSEEVMRQKEAERQRREAERERYNRDLEARRQKQERMEHRNQACADYVVQIASEGLKCPTCGAFSHNYRLSAKKDYPSLVICRSCEDAVPVPGW